MSRVEAVNTRIAAEDIQLAFEKHITSYNARITNMKGILGHSLLSFDIYMQWYPLYHEVIAIAGNRGAYLFAFSISAASDCPLCSTFFRKIIVDAGEDPENLILTDVEQDLLSFGSSIAKYHGQVPDEIFDILIPQYTSKELVVLVAFAGQMIATNIFNNVFDTDIDEYLYPYLKKSL